MLTANLFALMGLRQLYFLIGGLLKRLVYLSIGLAVLLAFIGVKLLLHALHTNELPFINGGENVPVPEIPIWMSLAAIVLILGTTTVLSLMKTRRDERETPSTPEPPSAPGAQAPVDSAGSLRAPRPRTSAEAATTSPMPSSWVGAQDLTEHDQPGQGGGCRFEAEQDAEHLRRQPPQRQQLERVGQHRRQHRDPQALDAGSRASTAARLPMPSGRVTAVATTIASARPSRRGNSAPVRPDSTMYAAQNAPAARASPMPTQSSSSSGVLSASEMSTTPQPGGERPPRHPPTGGTARRPGSAGR